MRDRMYGIVIIVLFVIMNISIPGFHNTAAYAEEEITDQADAEDQTEESTEQGKKKIIVTATRTNIEDEKVTKSVTVISEEQIERSKVQTVAEALRTVPGVAIRKQGGIGRNTSVNIRGGSTTQTLVLFDGVQSINSPTLGTADIADLFTTGIERIEVLRGGGSVLFGSTAQAGVVNIITKRGEGKPLVEALGEFGTNRTWRETASVSGSLTEPLSLPIKEIYFANSATRVDSDGIGVQNDYENWYFTNRVGCDLNEYINFDFVSRYWDSEVGLDGYPTSGVPAPKTDTIQKNTMLTIKPAININYGWYEGTIAYSGTFQDYYYREPYVGYQDESKMDIDVNKLDVINTIYFPEVHNVQDTFTVGFDLKGEDVYVANIDDTGSGWFDSPGREKATTQWGVYFFDELTLFERVILNGGVRVFRHNEFGRDAVWSTSAAYLHKETDTKIKASYDQSYRSPTINDLYWPDSGWAMGNPNLRPEEGEHYDIGIEQYLFDRKVMLGATYFRNDYSDLIQWSSGFPTQPENISSAQTQGVEIELLYNPTDTISFWANYTYVNTEDYSRNEEELWGTPRNMFSIGGNLRFLE
ncbi:MAG: TonB-dependent receptor, partial [Candidatus Omnitrophica bacterium]|nr:TonB-dependent receptor [Candidatus Omnitrophota bacterium]